MAPPNLDAFQVIADPSRRQILTLLSQDSCNINTLAQNFDMSRPAVSKHIKILQSAGFISIQSNGRERHCTLNQKGFTDLQTWLNYFDHFWVNKLQKLDAVLKDKKGSTKS